MPGFDTRNTPACRASFEAGCTVRGQRIILSPRFHFATWPHTMQSE